MFENICKHSKNIFNNDFEYDIIFKVYRRLKKYTDNRKGNACNDEKNSFNPAFCRYDNVCADADSLQ